MKGKRTYEDYEELGRRLIAAQKALGELSSLVFGMFPTHDELGRPLPTAYDSDLLERHIVLDQLVSQMALEYEGEAPDVQEGKPPVPPPFDREESQ